jgi:hypothetical protein
MFPDSLNIRFRIEELTGLVTVLVVRRIKVVRFNNNLSHLVTKKGLID